MIISICGKSGSGKSTLSRKIIESIPNAYHLDIDKIGHIVNDLPIVQEKLVSTFGEGILIEGKVNRKVLSKIVFNDKESMDKLKKITWCEMEKIITEEIKTHEDKIIILDWLLVYNTHFFAESDIKILINVPLHIRMKRILERDGITVEKFLERERNTINYNPQLFNIITDGSEENTEEIIRQIKKSASANQLILSLK